ncbi:reverse transcriptase domain-containing protein [Tanacetum coccineum]|uniref:Reverse transcriptase domain-containing protein n=1 Tax=Tanacetum coccineum TaxID=301880 RepID=A0ABQ5GD50_9ASTR
MLGIGRSFNLQVLDVVPAGGGAPEGQDDREGTPPLTKEQIEGRISAMKSIIKDHNKRNKANPIRLNFKIEDQDPNEDRIVKGKEVDDGDLNKPFKETLRTPFTRRIIKFSSPEYIMPTNIALYDGSTNPTDHLNRFVGALNLGERPMPVWCRMFQQTLDGSARGWFESLSPNSIDEWWKLREAFTTRYSIRKECYKEPHEITKIVRKANETLTAFKERWSVMSSASSAVTYTSVYTDSEPGRVFWGADEEISDGGSPRVIVYGYDGLPMQPVDPPSPDYVPGPEHPSSPDYVPGPEHPPSPIEIPYVPEPEYPEYLVPSEDEAPMEDQPLPADASPVALSPGYVPDSDPEEDPEEDSEEEHADCMTEG